MNRSAMSRIRVALNALLLLPGCLAGAAVAMAATGQPALAGTVPHAPSGWTTVFGADFAGAAGSAPSSANWFSDTGTDKGSREVNRNTGSTSNVYRGGDGHLGVEA